MTTHSSAIFALLCIIFASTLAANDASCCTVGSATYRITFEGIWTNTASYPYYPTNFPHWSPFIGAIHSPAVTVYEYGKYASSQVKSVAEAGQAQPLKNLLTPMTSKVKKVFVSPGGSLGPTAKYSVTVDVDNNFNLLSALTMIAPSPDWCVGVSRVNFCTKQCGFIGNTTMDLYLWDAGTKAGAAEQYTYTGSTTNRTIYQLKSTNDSSSVFYRANGGSLPPYAKLHIERLSQNIASNDATCCSAGSATYELTFEGIWVNSSAYPFYPSNFPHWSTFIGAIHSPALTVYSYGQYASPEVESVAEAGKAGPLKNLLTPMTDKVKKVFVSPGAYLGPTAKYTVTVDVNKNFNLLSALTMIAPSPDWCVGVSRVNFCTKQCGFIGNTTLDLYLWDAGTKAGPTEQYTYAGSATNRTIYQLKSTNDSSSVFYRANGTSLPPFAKLHIRLLSLGTLGTTQAATVPTTTRVPTATTVKPTTGRINDAMAGPSRSIALIFFALVIANVAKFLTST